MNTSLLTVKGGIMEKCRIKLVCQLIITNSYSTLLIDSSPFHLPLPPVYYYYHKRECSHKLRIRRQQSRKFKESEIFNENFLSSLEFFIVFILKIFFIYIIGQEILLSSFCLFILFIYLLFNWRIIALQCCVGFCFYNY